MATYMTAQQMEAKHKLEPAYFDGCTDYHAGLRDMMYETLRTLGDFATSCAGLGSERMTPEEMFDRVARNLAAYYNAVLEEQIFAED